MNYNDPKTTEMYVDFLWSTVEYWQNIAAANKDEDMALAGFVGFGLSYSGKWFGGYCRSKDKRN